MLALPAVFDKTLYHLYNTINLFSIYFKGIFVINKEKRETFTVTAFVSGKS